MTAEWLSYLPPSVRNFVPWANYFYSHHQLHVGWDDVGDFSSLADLIPAEANQPRVLGDNALGTFFYQRNRTFRMDLTTHTVLTEQVAGGIVVPGSGRLVSLLGVDDLIVVDMPDTLLVTTRARSQEVKRLVKKCKEQGWKQLL